MHATMGPDPARDVKRPTLAARAFASLFRDWDLATFECLHVATPRGTPLIAGENLSEVVGAVRGAAVRDRCLNGTGWPPRTLA